MDARVLGWLTRALQHELSAVQHYLAQSVLARALGDSATGDRLRAEALEELAHAERLMKRLIELGVAPSAGQLAPARLGRGPEDFATLNRQLEQAALALYHDAAEHAHRVRDFATQQLFEELLDEEVEHLQKWSDCSATGAMQT